MNPNEKKSTSESLEDKARGAIKNIKENKKVEEFYDFAKGNKRDTFAYVLLAIGLLVALLHPFVGGFMIGFVTGLYYSDELYQFIQNARSSSEVYQARYVVLMGTLLGLLILAPGLVIGATLIAAIKHFFFTNTATPAKK